MKVKELIKYLRTNDKISIREENNLKFITWKNEMPKEYLDREIIDIIPNYNMPHGEYGCFVINVKGED